MLPAISIIWPALRGGLGAFVASPCPLYSTWYCLTLPNTDLLCLTLPDVVLLYLMLSYSTWCYLTLPDVVLLYLVLSYSTLCYLSLPETVLLYLTLFYLTLLYINWFTLLDIRLLYPLVSYCTILYLILSYFTLPPYSLLILSCTLVISYLTLLDSTLSVVLTPWFWLTFNDSTLHHLLYIIFSFSRLWLSLLCRTLPLLCLCPASYPHDPLSPCFYALTLPLAYSPAPYLNQLYCTPFSFLALA